ncbi:hypothetical protein [Halorussus litoreus]|uniref:hypothetical protein n=1 Tax=Halorussus litoreus TaxID=1710536 RepID=UPI000E23560A|nr:hypothetical protein [Halorussus litoreus]
MSDRDSSATDEAATGTEFATGGVHRRGVLGALAAGLGGVGLARGSFGPGPNTVDPSGYVIEQGDQCVPITPLSGEETVEAFYDYRTPNTDPSAWTYSSYGTTDLQRPETSICFLYEGPEGLSLVVVHDELNDGTNGGAATFDLAFEHPDRGAWVVADDDYDGSSNYDTFSRTDSGWTVDWTWSGGRTDGGAYRPLGDDFAVTVDPAFNEDAALYGDYYEGEITDWEFLSGDRSDPDRVSLALDQPLTIRPGTCGSTTTTRTETTTEETTTEETTTADEETTEEKQTTEDDEQSAGPISAAVEILPGKVNPRSHGRLPVVVYSGEGFDATALGEISFGPASAAPSKRIRTDADGDGQTDLKLLFRMDDLDVDWNTGALELEGKIDAGQSVVGTADVDLVPRGGEDEETEDDDEDSDDERDEDEERERESADDGDDTEEERESDDEDEDDEDERESDDEDDRGENRGRGNGRDNGDDRENDEDGRERGNGRGRGERSGRGNGNGRGESKGHGNGKGNGK